MKNKIVRAELKSYVEKTTCGSKCGSCKDCDTSESKEKYAEQDLRFIKMIDKDLEVIFKGAENTTSDIVVDGMTNLLQQVSKDLELSVDKLLAILSYQQFLENKESLVNLEMFKATLLPDAIDKIADGFGTIKAILKLSETDFVEMTKEAEITQEEAIHRSRMQAMFTMLGLKN